MPRLSNAPVSASTTSGQTNWPMKNADVQHAGAPAALLEGQRPSAQVSSDGQQQPVAEAGDHREDDDQRHGRGQAEADQADAGEAEGQRHRERRPALRQPAEQEGADRGAEGGDRAGRADGGGGLDADVVELEGQLDDQDVEDQPAEQRDADRRGQRSPRQRRQLLRSRGRLRPRRRLPDEARGGDRQRQADGVEPERRPPVLRAQRAADAEEDRRGDRREDHLQAEVPLPLRAVEVVGEQRRAAGHDRGLGEPDQHPADDDQLQRGQPQRRGADERRRRPARRPAAACGRAGRRSGRRTVAVRPMTSAGAVSTIGVSASTPGGAGEGVLDLAAAPGASRTAPSTARQLDSSRTRAWARPAGRPVAGSTATSPASGSSASRLGTHDVLRHGHLRRRACRSSVTGITGARSVRTGAAERKSLLLTAGIDHVYVGAAP